MRDARYVLFVCEKYFLRFYRPVADRLLREGFAPLWVSVDGPDRWPHAWLDPAEAIESLAEGPELPWDREDDLCTLERTVFEQTGVFSRSYPYTVNVVRSLERARRLARAWYHATLALQQRFRPAAMFIWNGRYLPYSAVSAACDASGQPCFTSEIGWVPGTIFVDRGPLSPGTTDLAGRTLDATTDDPARAARFLQEYRAGKATMVSQTIAAAADVRRDLLGPDGRFLLVYGCQVDWDTNVVIGARRFRSNEAAVAFLLECMAAVPGARLAVKTHPLDTEHREDVLRRLVGGRGTVVTDVHPHTLIEAADCVAVRNSTLGFETLCYGKPLLLLEHAKYRHPRLTLEAADVSDGAAHLRAVADGRTTVPDPDTLRRLVVHLLDHYLVPARYQYYFASDALGLLSHFAANDSHQVLAEVLRAGHVLTDAAPDVRAATAIARCRVHPGPGSPSFLRRQFRRVAGWLS